MPRQPPLRRRPIVPLGVFGLGLLAIAATRPLQAAADPAVLEQLRQLSTSTMPPRPSAALLQALGPAVSAFRDEARSPEAALAALDALDPALLGNDFDRAWTAIGRAAALQALGRDDEARAAYHAVRQQPRTPIQDRRVLAALHTLGEVDRPGWCPAAGGLAVDDHAATPAYPALALKREVEGWVLMWLDVDASGAIVNAIVDSSSLRIFEAPASDWLKARRWQTRSGSAPGRPCFARSRVVFDLEGRVGHIHATAPAIDDGPRPGAVKR